jgi:hypothetical protein
MAQAAFNIASRMEDDVAAVREFGTALEFLAETFGDPAESSVIHRIGREVVARAKIIEDGRGKLFHLLHPNREQFEKNGWPGDGAAPDPIFAAIEAHRRAHQAYVDANDASDKAGDKDPALDKAANDAGKAADDVACQLLEVMPATMAGALALLRYAHEYEARGDGWPDGYSPGFHVHLYDHVANAIENIAAV